MRLWCGTGAVSTSGATAVSRGRVVAVKYPEYVKSKSNKDNPDSSVVKIDV